MNAGLQASTIFIISLGGRVPQIVMNVRNGGSGQLSMVTCGMNVAGCFARMFTTLVLTQVRLCCVLALKHIVQVVPAQDTCAQHLASLPTTAGSSAWGSILTWHRSWTRCQQAKMQQAVRSFSSLSPAASITLCWAPADAHRAAATLCACCSIALPVY